MKKNIEYVFVYNGKRYHIIDLHFNYSQKQEDRSGKPITFPRHSPILLYLRPMGKNKDRELVQQYVSKRLFEGHIEFLIVEDGIENRIMRHLEFANAKLSRLGISTQYPGHEGKEILRIEISPYIVKHGDTITEWACNPSNPFKQRNTPVITHEQEPEVIRQYITDREDNILESYKPGDKIYCVLESQGMINQYVDVNMSDKKVDFLYEGKRLKKDRIKDYKITSSIEKIPLEVIAEDHKDE